MMEEPIEFFGGYVRHIDDPHYVELGLKSGPFRTATGFVEYDEDAAIADPFLSRVRTTRRTVGLRMDRQVWDALISAATEDQTARCARTVVDLRQARDIARADVAGLRDLLRSEKARADAAIAREEAADEAAEQFEAERDEAREKSANLASELCAARAALRREPAHMVIHTTAAEKTDWLSGDVVTADVLGKIAATAPVGSLVDDLKNVIVSQAREIARLKGESE
ncbi:hypothetical protein OTB20_08430 [Streptomyces sp. H27-H1]|uniref:hypothetical protein n=1 Tax=Streptomyces sp. H27-H1 TaxID=2996461 RepID=UPI00226F3CF1|nr:hypothetical protein [Streptomyces sp. H27-H1]MCY0926231.1 hypothetical protein [Streptomyces sp. H27-H1]